MDVAITGVQGVLIDLEDVAQRIWHLSWMLIQILKSTVIGRIAFGKLLDVLLSSGM